MDLTIGIKGLGKKITIDPNKSPLDLIKAGLEAHGLDHPPETAEIRLKQEILNNCVAKISDLKVKDGAFIELTFKI